MKKDEMLEIYTALIKPFIENACKIADEKNLERDNLICEVAERLYLLSEISTFKHFEV